MIITRNISLDKDCIEKMKPYVEKHKGNFSAAIRDIINTTGRSGLPENISAIDNSLLKSMLDETRGILIKDSIIDEMIDPYLINSMRRLEEYICQKFSELRWGIELELNYDNDKFPSNVLVEIKGNPQKMNLAAQIVVQYLVKNLIDISPLEIKYVLNFNEYVKIELIRSNKDDSWKSLIKFFGGMDDVAEAIKIRPDFWKTMVNRYVLNNYNMVTVHRNYFEDLLAGKVPPGEITIENLAKKPLKEIPLKKMLYLIKDVYETSGVADRVEIDKENIILFHNYRSNEAIDKLKKILIKLLGISGHLFDANSTANMIVLTHRPDVGVKINEIVDNLRISSSKFDQELVMFMTFLKGLKDIPDIPLSFTFLGRRMGHTLMKEYEKENDIKNWSQKDFQNALEMIDSKIHRESEWNLEGKNLLYTVNKCNIVADGNSFDTYICHTARETFKGAMSYVFGNKAELEVRKLLSHGDEICEVAVKIP